MARTPLLIGFLSLLLIATAGPAPQAAPFDASLAVNRAELVSVGQVKDVNEGDPHAAALELFVEKLGLPAVLSDSRFHGEMACTYGELMLLMAGGLERLSEMAALKPEEEFVPVMKRVFDPMHAAAGHQLTSIDSFKKIPENSPYREAVATLVERFGGYVGAKGDELDPAAAVSRVELAEFVARYCQETAEQKRVAALSKDEQTAPATRAEMAVALARGLEHLLTLLE